MLTQIPFVFQTKMINYSIADILYASATLEPISNYGDMLLGKTVAV
jgi:hypothetical protein